LQRIPDFGQKIRSNLLDDILIIGRAAGKPGNPGLLTWWLKAVKLNEAVALELNRPHQVEFAVHGILSKARWTWFRSRQSRSTRFNAINIL